MKYTLDLDFMLTNEVGLEVYRLLDNGLMLPIPEDSMYYSDSICITCKRRTLILTRNCRNGESTAIMQQTVINRCTLTVCVFLTGHVTYNINPK